MDCTDITTNLTAATCGQAPVPGTGAEVVFINYDDIDRTTSVIADNVISSLILKAATTGYLFTSLEDSVDGVSTLNVGTYFKSWQQDVATRVFTKSELAKAWINNAAYARVVAIVRNKDIDTGKTKYELYGWDAGLEVTAAVSDTNMTDSVVYDVTFGSSENAKEGSLPKSIFITDEATTDALIATLYTA